MEKTQPNREKIIEFMGEAMETKIYEMQDRTTIVKTRINLCTTTQVMTGMYIGSKNNGVNWVDFRDERLPMLCF